MQVIIDNIEPNTDALTPELIVHAQIKYSFFIEAPISIVGCLKTSDGKKVALLNEVDIARNTTKAMQLSTSYSPQADIYFAKLNMPLSHSAIEHIERVREKNPTQSTILYFDFVIKSIEVRENGPVLQVQVEKCECQFSITQSTWIYKYAEYLKIGNFLLVELLVPDKKNVSTELSGLYERLYVRLQQMETNIRKGNWEEVMKVARQFYENLHLSEKKPFHTAFIEGLKNLFLHDRHTEEGFDNFKMGIFCFFEYTSKFIHDQDKRGQLQSTPIPRKEDAYFVYSLALNLLNVIGTKLGGAG